MKRRNFLKQTGLIAVVVGANPAAVISFPSRWGRALPPLACLPTTEDILGPFYRTNAPFRTDLTISGEPGTVFQLEGKVISTECPVPLNNAVVDIWQANNAGAYDNISPDYKYRGRQNTDAEGKYAFSTIIPGQYLNGNQYRPSHIHFRVTAPNYVELITQMYFQGDPYIPIDPWASDPDAALRILPVQEMNGVKKVSFEIYLQALPTDTDQAYEQITVRVFSMPSSDQIVVQATDTLIRAVEVFAVNGDLLKTAYQLQAAEIALPAGDLPAAIYFVRVKTDKGIFVEKLAL
jgi:protocatechuate 3,4-dioxygenase beta subunit